MCDTVVITGDATKDGHTIFGKNSDREPNEAHQLVHIPAADHAPGSRVKLTYIDIPQVAHTHALLLAKPFWIWGAEMGSNEHGLVIGNEAVFTKMPYQKKPGMIGMDFLRLALERAATARDAVTVITDLLAEYGQGGNCGFDHKLFYHNSFIIADPNDAWVLETADRQWAAKKVRGVYTISNGLTIGTDWDLASPGLVDHAVEKGWCRSPEQFNFSDCYSDFLYTTFSDCRRRCQQTTQLLSAQIGQVTPSVVMAALRSHGHPDTPSREPAAGITGATVCMHASAGPVRGSQTTGSMVSHLHPANQSHFFTGTAAPCTSIFKPVWFESLLPDMGPEPAGTFDESTLFWRHELLHRETLSDYGSRIQMYQSNRDSLEQEFVTAALEAAGQTVEAKSRLTASCFERSSQAEYEWLALIRDSRIQKPPGWLYKLAWNGFNRKANMPAAAAERG